LKEEISLNQSASQYVEPKSRSAERGETDNWCGKLVLLLGKVKTYAVSQEAVHV